VRRGCLAALLVFVQAASLAAQTGQPPSDSPSLHDVVEEDAFRDLPVTDSLFSVLDTVSAAPITDRFSSGGLSAAESSRVGAFMNSWTQTTFRLGDVDITSPDGGVPMLVPPLLFWQRIGVTTGGMPADASTPALLISLDPRRPSAQWTGTIDAFGVPPALVANPDGAAPAIARPHASTQGGAVVSGPLVPDRLGVLVSAAWTRSSQFDRGSVAANAVPSEAGIASVFGHLLYTPDAQTDVRTIVWIQRAGYPSAGRVPYSPAGSSDHDAATHVQSTWEHRASQSESWRVFGGVTTHTRNAASPSPGPATIERLNDGPIPALVDAADGTRRRWTLGLRFNTSPSALGRMHGVDMGFDAGRASARVTPAYPGSILERVDGIPARAWQYSSPREAHRSATTLDGFVADRIDLSKRLTLDAALRFDGVTGAARDAAQGVAWRTWLPRAAVRWSFADLWRLALISSYSRTADALTLGTLAYGDPASPVADVYRWRGGGNLGPLVARVGPGAGSNTGSNGVLSTIDADVARPTTSELDIGIEASPLRSMRLRFAHTLKRESHALAVIDTGAPASSYAVSGIPDVGGNFQDPRDDQILPIYDRLPASFGADRYLLTNSPNRPDTYRGMNLSVQLSTNNLFLFAGGTTSESHVQAANRGFRVTEADSGILGERLTNPNAATHARGYPFSDRSYNVKISGVYRFSRGVRLGVIARYQDGQPFSRMVVVPDLNQGAEAIRAIRNGGSRFCYTGTLDVRMQKEFTRGRRRVTLVMDVYNLPGMRKEVEEYVVTGPNFRDITAVQPPRTVLLGVRFSM
jgi:hypothetical protein